MEATKNNRMISLGGGNLFHLHVPLAIGTLQWGTTPVDQHVINSKGCISETTAREILNELKLKNVTLFDTAEGYGGGTSEKRLGRCTAAVYKDQSLPHPLLMTKFLPAPWRFTHASFERALRSSLQRLGIDCCPIYLLHSPIHLWRPVEFWVESAAICKRKGLLMAMGLSNCDADQVRRAVKAGRKFGVPIVVNQVMFNLLDYQSSALQEMKIACDELNVKIVSFSPLGQGLLTDNLTKESFQSNRQAKMMHFSWDALTVLRRVIKRIGDDHGGKSMVQVVINWCIAHDTVPLVGCRTLRQAKDSLGALEWKLTKEEVKELDDLAFQRSTFEGPSWRRGLFVSLFSIIMVMCRICDMLGFGLVLEASH